VSSDTQIRNAIVAHTAWEETLRTAIDTGVSAFTVENVCRDDRCRLGQWLGELDAPVQASFRWQCVKSVHAEFHREAAKVLGLALAKKAGEARSAMGYASAFAGTSAKLTQELRAWQTEAVHGAV
jgi:hypothetical protein